MAGTLHLVCGKIAAGKSTLCARLAAASGTVLIGEDAWLKALFGEEMLEVADYLRASARLRLAEAAGAAHILHYLDVPDAECRARLRRRNEEGGHDFAATDEQFDLITSYFQPPADAEGLNVVREG